MQTFSISLIQDLSAKTAIDLGRTEAIFVSFLLFSETQKKSFVLFFPPKENMQGTGHVNEVFTLVLHPFPWSKGTEGRAGKMGRTDSNLHDKIDNATMVT